ncbi:MAG TPA: rRNA adenine N-6-methyltransferase family protein [Desulfobacteria bacterium]|nr:rRNA adenine N-6-methyltransferase family protein [Desulfobacteria bacterium]
MTMDRANDTSLRGALVDFLIERGFVSEQAVINALMAVPRHHFVGSTSVDAYEDRPLPIKETNGEVISTISQPSIVAHMLETLQVSSGQRILEIGTGLGYNAALLSHLTGPNGLVVSIEFDAELAARASGNLSHYNNVVVVHGDGRRGNAAFAPFDRIIATAKASDIYPGWQEQLALDGLLLVPFEYHPGLTRLLRLQRTDGGFHGKFGWSVNFVPMAGEKSGEEVEVGAIKRFLARGDLRNNNVDDFLFFYYWRGAQPEAALQEWRQLASPPVDAFNVSTKSGLLSRNYPSITLGLSI